MAVGMVAHCHEDARKSIAMLQPADLNNGNLLENLRQQAEVLTRGGEVTFSLTQTGALQDLPPAVETALLRIGHEAITNAIRHANPSCIEIRLDLQVQSVHLEITDNGCGFEPYARTGRGFGLRAMHARATSQGGTLDLTSTLEAGTTVRITLPLKRHKNKLLRLLSPVREERV
jgi:signal transduction histidine kinase